MLIFGGIAAWAGVDSWRLHRLSPEAAVTSLYRRIYRHARWLGAFSRQGDTPYEFAASLMTRVGDLAGMPGWGTLLISSPTEIGWLTDLCVRALYSPDRPEAAEQVQAIHTWRRLRRRLWLARLFVLAARPGSGMASRSHGGSAK